MSGEDGAVKEVKLIDFSKMTPEELAQWQADVDKRIKDRYDRLHNRVPPTPREGPCRLLCPGKITETFTKEFNPNRGPLILGPGSKHQFHWVSSGLYCNICGTKYQFLPKS